MKLPAGFFRQLGLAGNPAAPPVLLARLARSPFQDVLAELAGRAELDQELLVDVFARGGARAKFTSLTNSCCPPSVLVVIADSEDPLLVADAVRHPNFPPSLLAKILRGVSWPDLPSDVALGVLANPSLSVPEMTEAIGGSRPADRVGVRVQLASNPALPAELAALLATDDFPAVRASLAGNPALSPGLVVLLAADPDPWVRFSSAKRSDLPSVDRRRLISELAGRYPDDTAALADLPPAVAIRLPGLVFRPGLLCLAANPSIPPALVSDLASSADRDVRRAALRNPTCPPDVLRLFTHDQDPGVRAAVARNPSTPTHVLEELSADVVRNVRAAVAGNPQSPLGVAETLLSDSDRMVVLAAARSQRLPEAAMRAIVNALSGDSEV